VLFLSILSQSHSTTISTLENEFIAGEAKDGDSGHHKNKDLLEFLSKKKMMTIESLSLSSMKTNFCVPEEINFNNNFSHFSLVHSIK
jgi:hypothetical protein